MESRSVRPGGILHRLRAPLGWSEVDRCLLAAALCFPWGPLWLAWLLYVLAHPGAAPFIDPRGAKQLLAVFALITSGWLAIAAAGLWLRRRRLSSNVLFYAVTLLFGLGYGLVSTFFGPFTSAFPASMGLVGLTFGLVLLERRAVVIGATSLYLVIVSASVGQWLGLVPYAPLLREAPFHEGRLAPSWLASVGGFEFVLMIFVTGVIYVFLCDWRERGLVLESATAEQRRRAERLEASIRDVSRAYAQLKRAEGQLVQSEKMASLGQLVAGVAHDLRNPTSFVRGSIAVLDDHLRRLFEMIDSYQSASYIEDEARRGLDTVRSRVRLDYIRREAPELLRICAEGVGRIERIVDDLSIFARADQGRRVPIDLREHLEETFRLLEERASQSRTRVLRQYQATPLAEIHPEQLRQVWLQLLRNALDAVEGRPHPEIRVAVRPGASGWLEVAIADNGAGIAPSALGRVFEPFYTTKPIGHGTGLGLSIAYGVIRAHEGEILLDSDDGSGTVVTVRLPVRANPSLTSSTPSGEIA